MISILQLEKALSFQQYMDLTQQIIDNPTPSEPYSDVKMMNYTVDNMARMNRVLTNISIDQKLYNLLSTNQRKMVWVVLSEPWCGDASQIVPALASFAAVSENITFKILLRDSNLEVMDSYLTNGGRSIPKFICIDEKSWTELGVWGPRPKTIQQIVLNQKNNTEMTFAEKVKQIHVWYDENKTRDIQNEFIELLKQWNEVK
ncbi:MAG TPA: thioredoxin family protein [Chitinophagales bacterium]|nr:thioredoxin family protein [Chitinophagales bacterium]